MHSIGVPAERLLRAIANGRVVRDDCDGTRRGMWALYRTSDGEEVGIGVRRLRKLALVNVPLLGPPRINSDGLAWLRDHPESH